MCAPPDVAGALRTEGLLDAAHIAALEALLGELARDDPFDLQERFVLIFDRSRILSLNLFEIVHGDAQAHLHHAAQAAARRVEIRRA
jgi:nitrate reductase molybdenum cofactor assembly chaperone NarJ/NarW